MRPEDGVETGGVPVVVDVDRVGAEQTAGGPSQQVVPVLLKARRRRPVSGHPEQPHHLAEGADVAGGRTPVRFRQHPSHDVAEQMPVGLPAHQEAIQRLPGIEHDQPSVSRRGDRIGNVERELPGDGVGVLARRDDDQCLAAPQPLGQVATHVPRQELVVAAVQLHDRGFIWAYSEPGQGTTFKVYLPVAASRPAEPATGPADPVGGAEVVLLAEDDDGVRGVVARSLREYGYTVLEARRAEALEVAAAMAAPPSLVIADVVMPRINGNQLYAEIQQRWPETPMLFISGYTYSDTVSRGLIGERCEFLQKPMEPEQLARTVRRLLQARKRTPS